MDSEKRKERLKQLADLVEFFTANPDLPIPDTVGTAMGSVYDCENEPEFNRLPVKSGDVLTEWESGNTRYKCIGVAGRYELYASLNLEKHCEAFVVGQKHVPEKVIPAHTVDIIEYRCKETDDEASITPINATLPSTPEDFGDGHR